MDESTDLDSQFSAYHSQIMECLLSLKSDLIYVSCTQSMCPVFLVVLISHDENVLFDVVSMCLGVSEGQRA